MIQNNGTNNSQPQNLSCSSNSKSTRKGSRSRSSSRSKIAKKRGRPRIHPKLSPKPKGKRGRPRNATYQANLTTNPSFTTSTDKSEHFPQEININKKKKSIVPSDDETLEEENFDEATIPVSDRVLRNQEQIDHEISTGGRPILNTANNPSVSGTEIREARMAIYNDQTTNNLQHQNMLNKNRQMMPKYSIARLMMLTAFDFTQTTFTCQELIRFQINLVQLQNLINYSWLLIQNVQLPYNLLDHYFLKITGLISIEEEFISFSQLGPFGYVKDNQETLANQVTNEFLEQERLNMFLTDEMAQNDVREPYEDNGNDLEYIGYIFANDNPGQPDYNLMSGYDVKESTEVIDLFV